MDFGLLFTFSNPGDEIPDTDLVETQLAQAVLAEELGYDHVWIASHPGSEMYFPQQFPMLAAIAVKTSRIRLGNYIVALPLYHPLHVVEEAVTVDVLSRGRLEFGVGAGNFVSDFDAYGASRRDRAARMEDGLTIIKGLWTDEDFTYEGKHFSIPPGFRLNPRPVQKEPPLWVAGTSERAIDRAARYGAHLAGTATGFDYYESRLREHGRDPAGFHKGILQFVHVAETRDQAWKNVGRAIIRWLEYYKTKFEEHGDFDFFKQQPGGFFGADPLPDPDDLEQMQKLHFLGSPFIVGDPQVAIDWVESAKQLGATHAVMAMQFGGIDPRLSESSIRLFAEEVIPAVAGDRESAPAGAR